MKRAFFGGYDWHESNTEVKTNVKAWDYSRNSWITWEVVAYLHGNAIAAMDKSGNVRFSCAGWHTRTTASRLRALGANVRIKDYCMIFADSGEVVPSKLS